MWALVCLTWDKLRLGLELGLLLAPRFSAPF